MTCYDPLTIMAALLMLAHHTTFIRTINLETNHGEERSQRGIALLNNNYSSFYAGNYPSCLIACISDPQCKSFNFWWPNLMCDLNNKTKHLAEAKFLSQDISSTYMGLMREPGKIYTYLCDYFLAIFVQIGFTNQVISFLYFFLFFFLVCLFVSYLDSLLLQLIQWQNALMYHKSVCISCPKTLE